MTFSARARQDTATLWTRDGVDSVGDPQVSAPTTISVKWERKEAVFRGADGSERRANHVVYLGQDVSVGDFLFEGTSTNADPKAAGALIVQDFQRIESFGGKKISRMALL